jgi:hypothetical protein
MNCARSNFVTEIIILIFIFRRIQRIKKGEDSPGQGEGRGRFLGLQYWYRHRRGDRNRGNNQQNVDNANSDFHNLEEYAAPPTVEGRGGGDVGVRRQLVFKGAEGRGGGDVGGGRNDGYGASIPRHWSGNVSEISYETEGELDLRLQPAPTVSYATSTQAKTQSAQFKADRQNLNQSRNSEERPASVSSAKMEKERAEKDKDRNSSLDRSTPLSDTKDGEKSKDQLRKEKFVAKVLDESIESIKHQREHLSTTPEPQNNGNPKSSSKHGESGNYTPNETGSRSATPNLDKTSSSRMLGREKQSKAPSSSDHGSAKGSRSATPNENKLSKNENTPLEATIDASKPQPGRAEKQQDLNASLTEKKKKSTEKDSHSSSDEKDLNASISDRKRGSFIDHTSRSRSKSPNSSLRRSEHKGHDRSEQKHHDQPEKNNLTASMVEDPSASLEQRTSRSSPEETA